MAFSFRRIARELVKVLSQNCRSLCSTESDLMSDPDEIYGVSRAPDLRVPRRLPLGAHACPRSLSQTMRYRDNACERHLGAAAIHFASYKFEQRRQLGCGMGCRGFGGSDKRGALPSRALTHSIGASPSMVASSSTNATAESPRSRGCRTCDCRALEHASDSVRAGYETGQANRFRGGGRPIFADERLGSDSHKSYYGTYVSR
jgi:hypothetical protein